MESNHKELFDAFCAQQGLTPQQLIESVFVEDPERISKIIYDHARLSTEDLKRYRELYSELKTPSENTKEQGDKLENLVNFLIDKSYFYKVKHNRRTSSNQLDQVIVLSDKGKAMMQAYQEDLTRTEIVRYLNIPKVFLGECKNYPTRKLKVDHVGKVYSIMKSLNYKLAIVFSIKGITGSYGNWTDGLGLIKTLRLIEKYESGQDYFYIIDFNEKDFKRILEGENFFAILNEKIEALEEGIVLPEKNSEEKKFIMEVKLDK